MYKNRSNELREMKQISMFDILGALNIQSKKHGFNHMFSAVWRNEEQASVSIRQANDGVWVFFDHGTGEKGTNIDLVMYANGCSYVSAVQFLRKQFLSTIAFSFPKPKTIYQESLRSKDMTVSSWIIYENREPKKFLQIFKNERRLSRNDLLAANIRELNVRHGTKDYNFLIAGHQNISGGWELFHPKPGKFKSCKAPKGLSWVKGRVNVLIIAESVIDAISAKKIYDVEADLLSLNTTRLARRAGLALRRRHKPYDRIILALDNDKSGWDSTLILKNYLYQMGPVEIMKYDIGKDPNSELLKKNLCFQN